MSQVRNPVILRTVIKGQRPAAAIRPHPLAPITFTITLVQTILARYRPFIAHWPGLSPIYRQEQPAGLAQTVHLNNRQNIFAPHLKLTLVAAASATPAPSHPATPFTWQVLRPPIAAPASEQLVLRLIQREQMETQAFSETSHRLMLRNQRLETVTRQSRSLVQEASAGAAISPPPALPAPALARPVARVVHRPPAPPGITEAEPNPAAAPSRWQPFTQVDSRPQNQPIGPPVIDVNRLTEQVMHNIDRRLNAYRERTGRM